MIREGRKEARDTVEAFLVSLWWCRREVLRVGGYGREYEIVDI
jgi:hypothetical protein